MNVGAWAVRIRSLQPGFRCWVISFGICIIIPLNLMVIASKILSRQRIASMMIGLKFRLRVDSSSQLGQIKILVLLKLNYVLRWIAGF